jgi:hypothetical protein
MAPTDSEEDNIKTERKSLFVIPKIILSVPGFVSSNIFRGDVEVAQSRLSCLRLSLQRKFLQCEQRKGTKFSYNKFK